MPPSIKYSNVMKSLKEAAVVNKNLAQIIKIVSENSTTRDEKKEIIDRFMNEAKTVQQSEALYESISKELKKAHKMDINESSNSNLTMTQELKDAIVRYYDFMTAYQNLLRGGGEETEAGVSSTSDVKVAAWPPALGNVTTFARQVGDRKVVHLLNFIDADNLSWRDMQGTMPEPGLVENLPLRMKATAKVNRIWVATPDALGGAVQELPFKQAGGEVTFTVPSLKYWTMIVVE